MSGADRPAPQVIAGCQVLAGEPMSRHTTLGVGGPAEFFAAAECVEDLVGLVNWARSQGIAFRVIGSGANLLVADAGVRGLVIANRAGGCRLSAATGKLDAGSGSQLGDLAAYTAARGWSGLEWAAGIPGTLGGAIVGNAGAFGGYLGNVVGSVQVLDINGECHRLDRSECAFGYRSSRFKAPAGGWSAGQAPAAAILGAELLLEPGHPQALQERMAGYAARRTASQPDEPSAGSVFKRTPDHPAGWLIEHAGLKGTRIGGAMISPKHGNFIVNLGGASAADVLALIDLCRRQVRELFGLELELEIELV